MAVSAEEWIVADGVNIMLMGDSVCRRVDSCRWSQHHADGWQCLEEWIVADGVNIMLMGGSVCRRVDSCRWSQHHADGWQCLQKSG